jgi:PadR family transcriptional regulator PadR
MIAILNNIAMSRMEGRKNMNAQFKKGALELCVLAQLETVDCYGYELTEAISSKMEIATGTLYLILKRLKDEEQVETYLVESAEGPARKYYHITDKGKLYLDSLKNEWFAFVDAVGELINKDQAKGDR